MMINWNYPAERARLADQLGTEGYNAAHAAHIRASVIATVNGCDIRPVPSRFGQKAQFAVSIIRMARR